MIDTLIKVEKRTNDDEESEEESEMDETDVLDDEEATLLISSEEEAELEAQRIRFHELIGKNLLQSRSSRLNGRSRGSSASSSVSSSSSVVTAEKEKQQKGKKTTQKAVSSVGRSQKRTNSTCSVASSLVTAASEIEACGNIFIYEEQQKLIFTCSFCDLRFSDFQMFSQHLHDGHTIFQEDDLVAPSTQATLPPRKSARNQARQLEVKKELTPPAEETVLTLPTDASSLKACGKVFALDRKKLFLTCFFCECKYANLVLFHKHLQQQHELFTGPTKEINVEPKQEVKTEVSTLTDDNEPPPMVLLVPTQIAESTQEESPTEAAEPSQPMVVIPEGHHLNNNDILPTQTPDTPPPEEEEVEKAPDNVVVSANESKENEEEKEKEKEKEEVQQPPTVEITKETNTESTPQAVPIRRLSSKSKAPKVTATPEPAAASSKRLRRTSSTKKSYKDFFTEQQQEVPKLSIEAAAPSKRKRKAPAVPARKSSAEGKSKASKSIATPQPVTAASKRLRRTSSTQKSVKDFFTVQQQPVSPTPESAASSSMSSANSVPTKPLSPTASSSKSSPSLVPANASKEDSNETQSKAATAQQPQLSCDICKKSFNRPFRLVEHLRLHTGEKPFKCEECGKDFRIKMRLTEHKLRHRKEKAFKCDLCGLAMATNNDLKLHHRHHSNDRRYQCPDCPKAFVRSADLKIHVRVHTGEKPFECEICQKVFRANQNLSVHRRSHQGVKNFKCEYCNKRFMRNIDRKVHHRTHTGERPFKCEICQRGYSSRQHVRLHIERDHVNSTVPRERKKPGPKPKVPFKEELAKPQEFIDELLQKFLNTHPDDDEDEQSSTMAAIKQQSPMPTLREQSEEEHSDGLERQQVSVTVSMQVENVALSTDDEPIPEKENDALHSPLKENVALAKQPLAATGTTVKRERKTTSYFTVVGQKTEI